MLSTNIILFPTIYLYITFLTIWFSIGIDLIIGDPKIKYHPVNVIGHTIKWFEFKFKKGQKIWDKLIGVFLLVFIILLFCIPLLLLQFLLWWIWKIWDPIDSSKVNIVDILVISVVFGFILKWAFAIKNLRDVTIPIEVELNQGNLGKAREDLSYIVRRNTSFLDNSHIISATVEVIAESSNDAATSVFFYYLIGNVLGIVLFLHLSNNILFLMLGIPFAYMFRIINTSDSIVGYKDEEHINIGWFSAKMDTFSNYIPARITAFFMLLVGLLYKKDIKNGWKSLKRDKNKTESVNAGWTMSTMAGLLNVQLEKIGYYKLGSPQRSLTTSNIVDAYKIVRLTVILFVIVISITLVCITQLIFL